MNNGRGCDEGRSENGNMTRMIVAATCREDEIAFLQLVSKGRQGQQDGRDRRLVMMIWANVTLAGSVYQVGWARHGSAIRSFERRKVESACDKALHAFEMASALQPAFNMDDTGTACRAKEPSRQGRTLFY